MKKLILALAAVAFFTGCTDPKSEIIPEKPLGNPEFKETIAKLEPEDREALGRYVLRSAFTESLTLGATTIGDAIDDQKKHEAEAAARKAESLRLAEEARKAKEAKIAELHSIMTMAVSGKRFVERDFMAGQHDALVVLATTFKNKSDRDLKGVKYSVEVFDSFNEKFITLSGRYAVPLAAGETVSVETSWKHNQFIDRHVKLKNAPFERLTFKMIPVKFMFEDGSELSAED